LALFASREKRKKQMAGTIKAQDFVRQAQKRREELKQTLQENHNAQNDYEQKHTALAEARAQALVALAELILPGLTPETVAAVLPLTGFRAFEVKSPFERLDERRRALTATIAEIENDARFTRREQILAELAPKQAALNQDLLKLAADLGRYTQEEGFVALADCGYGTPAYARKWWDLSYYADWKRGDELEERLSPPAVPGLEQKLVPFGELAARYFRVKRAHDACRAEFDAVTEDVRAVQNLVRIHEESAQGLTIAAHDTLENCRADLQTHLEYLDREDLARRCAARPDLVEAVKKLHGLEKKAEYLVELRLHYLEPERELLNKQIDKLGQKAAKFSRPKNYRAQIPATDANAWLADPRPKLNERRNRYRQAYSRINSFQDYHRYEYGGSALWWDVILEGVLNGDFIPEVRDHRTRFPPAAKRRDKYAATMQPETRREDLLEVS
jgi:hypothetical protein